MEEKELFWKLEDNADMSCVCRSINKATECISVDISDIQPEDRENIFYTITPVYLTEAEFDSLGDSQH